MINTGYRPSKGINFTPARIRHDVFGHALDRGRYGKGASLEHIAKVLAPVAI